MIQITNVLKRFGENYALNDISFEINKGEIVGLLGPNGAGKSTTMKLLVGLIMADEGQIKIDKKDINTNLEYIKSLIGYIPETNPLYNDMVTKDLIELSFNLHSSPLNFKERLEYVIKNIGLTKVLNRPIKELSKGYRQRVGLAQAIIHDPKILILDEPTEGLDPNQRFEIRNLIKDLGKDKTIIISTHVMQEVELMCSRVIILKDGRIKLDKSMPKVKEDLDKSKITLEEYFRTLTK